MMLCIVCENLFSSQSTHNRHVREVHNQVPKPVSYGKDSYWSNQCLDCDNAFPTNKRLIKHLEEFHNMQFQTDSIVLKDLNDFEKWKAEMEQLNHCFYVFKSKSESTTGEISYYYCNRSKTSYISKDNKQDPTKTRLQKSQGLCKLNYSCTSNVKLIKENNKILVEWQKIHYGHSCDLQHIRIPKCEKQIIASKLINGVTPRRILESTRDNISEHIKRVDLLTSKDIQNIKTSYGIESRDSIRHCNDAFSVDLWVQECKELKENPVLFYKPQGQESDILKKEDFCLVIMNSFQKQMIKKFPDIITVDGTHGMNGYDFEMTTVMIIDEFHHGFPVAIMFANRKDTMILRIFFNSIKESVGMVNNGIFMSDMAENFFNAWVMVMGVGSQHLFCSWHVDKAWQSNLNKISGKEKRDEVYKLLKTLQLQVSKSEFFIALNNALDYMCNDQESQSFGQYFKNIYSHNYLKWAYCFRENSNINTNMHLESMHKVLKYFYLERKTVKRLDKGIHSVLQYIRDKCVERLIRITKKEKPKPSRITCKTQNEDNNLLCEDFSAFSQQYVSTSYKKNNIKNDLKILSSKLDNFDFTTLDDSVLSQIHRHLAIINDITSCPQLIKDKDVFKIKNKTLKRVIEPQLRFVSTKKKRRVIKAGFKKAKGQEAVNIKDNLIGASDQELILFKSVSGSNDHQYCQ